MSISVRLESPPGTPVQTFNFAPGQSLHVAVQVRGSLGLGEAIPVSLEINPKTAGAFTPIYDSGYSNILGNKEFDVGLPYVNAKASVLVKAHWSLGGIEQQLINIGIGVDPDPQPGGPMDWQKMLLYAGLGFAGVFLVMKLIPQKTQVVTAANPRRRHKKFRTWS